jgi:hypothetical protein
MGRLCTVCTHPERQEIDLALLRHAESYRAIAIRYGMPRSNLINHQNNHLRITWEVSKGLQAMLSGDNLLDKLSALDEQTLEMLAEARHGGDLRTALTAVRESRGNIEAFSRIGPMSDIERRLDRLEHGDRDDTGNEDDEDGDGDPAGA